MALELPDPDRPLRIGTRGSPLALAQAHETRDRLMAAHGLADAAFEIVVIKTTGDRVQDRPLSELGGKGLFTREIEAALAAGRIDIAVHSMKDMPTLQPAGLAISTCLPRADVRDAFVTLGGGALAALAAGSTVGTSSLRRAAQLRHRRPDLAVVEFRGTVQTRLRKLGDGVAAATFLAMAGLERLGLGEVPRTPVDPDEMLPAVAQGAIGIEQRAGRRPGGGAAGADPGRGDRRADRGGAGVSRRARRIVPDADRRAGRARRRAASVRGEILRPDGSESLRHADLGPRLTRPSPSARKRQRCCVGRAGSGFFDG